MREREGEKRRWRIKKRTERDGNGTGVDAGIAVSNGPDGKNKDSRGREGIGETKGIYDTPCQ